MIKHQGRGFTLTEVMMGVLVFSVLLGLVVALQSGGSKAVTRMVWHNQVNRQGAFLEKFIPRAIEKASVPSVIKDDGTQVSTNSVHAIRGPAGTTVEPTGSVEKIVLAIPQSTAVSQTNATGKVNWTELVLVPETSGWSKGLGRLYTRERSVDYTASTYSTIARPTSGGRLDLIMEDISKIELAKVGSETVSLTIYAQYPRDRLNTQKFVIHGIAQNKAPITIP